ncbi:MAG: hypothetical protein KIH64_013010 [Mycobacterium sp.]|nr:hypothetical protein [Mycobacterium sp.]
MFSLLGTNENDLTAALGFVLAKCPPLAAALTQRICAAAASTAQGDLSLDLEERDAAGRTDLELKLGSSLFIVEAKRGWLLPGETQLAKSPGRTPAAPGGGALVTLSQASHALAAQSLPSHIGVVPVVHLPWRDVLADVNKVRADCRGHERLWLDEFNTYMKEVTSVRRVEDSWTYCVVLNDVKPGGTATFKEIVTEQLSYFHPYGIGGWPNEAPNFMAFRWAGAVQRIHRVVEHEVVPHLSDRWPELANEAANRPHAVYRLGPRLPPHEPIPNGASYRASRLWVLLDQLQSSPTLAAALAGSKKLASRQ